MTASVDRDADHSGARFIPAPARLIYRALLDPEAVGTWRAPAGMTCRVLEMEPVAGGRFRLELRYAAKGGGQGKSEEGLDRAMQAFFDALRPGGVLGVVDHRLPEDRDDEDANESGYIKQSWVVAAAERAGFELEDESDINANADDTADHEGGVWALPPTLRGGDEENSLVNIGESDRFTLKFRKPEE